MRDYDKVQKALEFAAQKFDGIETPKPALLHSIRVGLKLMDAGFGTDIIVAGILHDVVEDTDVTAEELHERYGKKVADLVAANSKDPTIKDTHVRREELIKRCCLSGPDALAVKVTDIYDNYRYYTEMQNQSHIAYCLEQKSYIQKYAPPELLQNDYIQTTLSAIT